MRSWHEEHLGVIVVSTIQPKRGKQISDTWVNQFWIRCPTRHAKTCRRLASDQSSGHSDQTRGFRATGCHWSPLTRHRSPWQSQGLSPHITTIPTPSPHSLLQSPPNSIKKQHFALLEYRSQQTFEYIFQNHNYSDLVEVQRSVCEAKNTGGTLTLSQAGLR